MPSGVMDNTPASTPPLDPALLDVICPTVVSIDQYELETPRINCPPAFSLCTPVMQRNYRVSLCNFLTMWVYAIHHDMIFMCPTAALGMPSEEVRQASCCSLVQFHQCCPVCAGECSNISCIELYCDNPKVTDECRHRAICTIGAAH